MSPTVSQQVLVVAVATGLLVLVVRMARRRMLDVGLASLWGTIALIGASSALLIPAVAPVGRALALTPAALLTLTSSLVLLVITLLLSGRLVRLQDVQQDLNEAIALGRAAPIPPAGASTLIVIPAWNEAASIADVVRGLLALGHPVLVVDDGSDDPTADLAARAGAHVVRLPVRQGVGAALRAGFRHATANGFLQVVQCDGDGQHPPGNVALLLDGPSDADLVIGSRFTERRSRRAEPVLRRGAMGMLSRTASAAARHPITDASSGSRLIREPLLSGFARSFPRHYLGDTFEATVAAARAGYVIREVPVTILPRRRGSSSASVRDAIRFTLRTLVTVATRSHLDLPRR